MARIDNYMIVITIGIVLLALAPFFSPTIEWEKEKAVERVAQAEITEKKYFDGLNENIEEAKEKVRDLMAEHEEANP